MIVSAQSSGAQSTNSSTWTPMPGLAIKLPQGVGEQALLILNVPNPYAQGNNTPGGNFGLQVDGKVQSAFASFTYNEANPPSTGRIPTTLCATVPLSQTGSSTVVAVWSGIRGATVRIDSPATLTAVVA
jgi:mannose-binding lectin